MSYVVRISALLLVIMSTLACRGIRIDSEPPGADILIDGAVTRFKTPRDFKVTHFGPGSHRISVSMPGRELVTPELAFTVHTSAGKIIWACLLPVPFLFTGLNSGFKNWTASSATFVLRPVSPSPGLELPEAGNAHAGRN